MPGQGEEDHHQDLPDMSQTQHNFGDQGEALQGATWSCLLPTNLNLLSKLCDIAKLVRLVHHIIVIQGVQVSKYN